MGLLRTRRSVLPGFGPTLGFAVTYLTLLILIPLAGLFAKSASLGAADKSGRRKALYEPVHGSAPDIAGKDAANPLASILSLAMMLRYSFDLEDEAKLLEAAVVAALEGGARTGDILQPGMTRVSTTQMGDTVLKELEKRA